jgi:glycerophosphoryl diester phosphodiesterase
VLNIAHRGARNVAPENTLEAIKKAAQLGADAVELDVQLSADGSVIVIHDDDLVRCTDARERFPDREPWRISDFTNPDIRMLDAGSWFAAELSSPQLERQPWLRSLTDGERDAYVQPKDIAHYASGGVRVPLLGECLQACSELALAVHIELKTVPRFYPGLAENVVGQIRDACMQERALISSFDHQQLARVAKLAPEIKTAVLSSDRMYRPAEYLARLRASAYNPACCGEYDTIGFGAVTGQLDRETIAEVRAAGYDVYVWTENDPGRMLRLIEAGVSGIYTDYPNRLRALLDSGMKRDGRELG